MSDQLDFNFPESANGSRVPIPALGGSTVIAFDGSVAMASDLATTFSSTSKWVAVRITPTQDAFITSAVAPAALNDGTHHILPAGIPQDIRFPANHKLAFIKVTTAGNAYVTLLK
jgi:hypothetical protein